MVSYMEGESGAAGGYAIVRPAGSRYDAVTAGRPAEREIASMCESPCGRRCRTDAAAVPAVDRREFLQHSVAVAMAVWAAACQGEYPTAVDPDPSLLGGAGLAVFPLQHRELDAVGGILTVMVDGAPPIALVRSSEAAYEAFWMSCPHQGTTVQIRGEGFRCPNHHAEFSLDGGWTGGLRTGPLKAVPLDYDAAARIIRLGKEPAVPLTQRKAVLLDVVVAEVPALTRVGGIAFFGLDNGYPAALVRAGEASYAAFSPTCPHLGYYVDADPRTGGFTCPGHQATFTSLGQWTGGQVTTNLKALASTFDAARGVVSITIP